MKRGKAILLIVIAYVVGIGTPYLAFETLHHLFRSMDDAVQEFSRSTSPDSKLDVVILQVNPGAFSSYLYELYIVPAGEKAGTFRGDPPIMRTAEGDQLKAHWVAAHFLSVDYGNSHIQQFANLWYSQKVPEYYVEISAKGAGYLQADGRFHHMP